MNIYLPDPEVVVAVKRCCANEAQPGRVQTPKHRNEVYCRQISRAAASNQSTRRYQRVSDNGQQNTVPAVQTVGSRQVLQIETKGKALTYLRSCILQRPISQKRFAPLTGVAPLPASSSLSFSTTMSRQVI